MAGGAVTPSDPGAAASSHHGAGVCEYAFTATRNWLLGVLTLVASLDTANGPHDGCGYRILWHPTLPDTVYTPGERALVESVAGRKSDKVRWQLVDSDRLAQYGRLPYLREGAIQSIVKLELFYEPRPATIVFLDVDMLVLKNLSFVHAALRADVKNHTPWRLHGALPLHRPEHRALQR